MNQMEVLQRVGLEGWDPTPAYDRGTLQRKENLSISYKYYTRVVFFLLTQMYLMCVNPDIDIDMLNSQHIRNIINYFLQIYVPETNMSKS